MCGRYTTADLNEQAAQLRFALEKISKNLTPSYNVAPSQRVPVILNESPTELTMAHWGLIPSWAKDSKIGYRMINARSETISEKSSFRKPFASQRCLVLADGFYEWMKDAKRKVPYRITLKPQKLFAMAGIWDRWIDPEGRGTITSVSIITVGSNPLMRRIHERMPAILPRDKEQAWLSRELSLVKAKSLLKPYSATPMRAYEVSMLVNSPKNNDPSVLKEV